MAISETIKRGIIISTALGPEVLGERQTFFSVTLCNYSSPILQSVFDGLRMTSFNSRTAKTTYSGTVDAVHASEVSATVIY